jgi:hypothetical protein
MKTKRDSIQYASDWLYMWGFFFLVFGILSLFNFWEELYFMERQLFPVFTILFFGLGYWMRKKPTRFLSILILVPIAFFAAWTIRFEERVSLSLYVILIMAIIVSYQAYKSIPINQ